METRVPAEDETGIGTGMGRGGWLFLAEADIPDRWRERAVPVMFVPLLPEETGEILVGVPARPELTEQDEALLRLMAHDASIQDAADQLGLHIRTVERRLASLRKRFNLTSTAELLRFAARRGF